MSSVYLRLAAPLQSWATARVSGNIVHTEMRPTLSGLCGLIAACAGIPRGGYTDWLQDLSFSIRVDKSGAVIDEYQTINPRDEDLEYQERIHLLMTGKRFGKSSSFTPDAQSGTSIIERTYLADAEFLVAVSGEHAGQVNEVVRSPRFTPYLGRKAFAPSFPFYLGMGKDGLLQTLPTTQAPGRQKMKELLADYVEQGDLPEERLQLWKDGKVDLVTVPALSREAWLQQVGAELTR